MSINRNINTKRFKINDFFAFFDGLDLSVNLSILLYLSGFIFGSYDTRIALIYSVSVILLSFMSRVFDIFLLKKLEKFKLQSINIIFLLLLAYFIPILIQKSMPIFLSIFILSISRILVGIVYSLTYRQVNLGINTLSYNILSLKHWVIYVFGLFFGSFLYLLVNEIYSNEFLNEGGWKIFYVLMFTKLFLFFVFIKFFRKETLTFNYDYIDSILQKQKISLVGILLIVPLISFYMFVSSKWLPKFSNPENLSFLNYDSLYLFLTMLIFLFISPLARLVGKSKSIVFFSISIFLISTVCIFIDHSSSYSINFLKFFISMVSAFSLCCFIIQSELNHKNLDVTSIINNFKFMSALLLPLLQYYFIYKTLNYSVIYILLSIVYFINYINFSVKKNG